jgi:hypothetical protein
LSIFDKGLQNPSRTWFETQRELNTDKPDQKKTYRFVPTLCLKMSLLAICAILPILESVSYVFRTPA